MNVNVLQGIQFGTAVEWLWIALAIYWFVSARRVKQSKATEGRGAFWVRVAALVVIFEFAFSSWGRIGWLGARFVPQNQTVQITGLVLTALGITIAIWARYCLGANWSGAVTLKEGHELIRKGPYRWVRHPIYTGMGVGFVGTALVVGEWRAVIAFGAIEVAHYFKARKEESWLTREFGASFEAHRARTGMFLPRLGAITRRDQLGV